MEVRAILRLRNDKMLAAREAKGWSQRQVAEAAGCTVVAVGSCERMQYNKVAGARAQQIADALGLALEDVLPPWAEGMRIETTITRTADLPAHQLLGAAEQSAERLMLPAPAEALEAKELSEVVREIIGTLPLELRATIVLHYYGHLGVREIAALQTDEGEPVFQGPHGKSVSYQTIGNRLRKGHEAIRTGLLARGLAEKSDQ